MWAVSGQIEAASTYKILGDHVDCDLKWSTYVRKQGRGFLRLRVLERVCVDGMSILKVYLTTIRAALAEYAIPVWQAIPGFLSDKMESLHYM